jgi:broad specificity phosphatase PhoE
VPTDLRWPTHLWIVRHGESAGNVARDAAQAGGLTHIDIATRDVDVPLSPLGEEQSAALGRWFGAMPPGERPNVVLSSPYVRARHTAEIVRAAAGIATDEVSFVFDERLREKEFGVLDRLTRLGIERLHPEQAELRALLGKFYHRPPGGESWCDVILRLRSLVDTISRDHHGARVLVVCHQVIVLCMRYLLERMTEEEVLAVDRAAEVANCSVTAYAYDPAVGQDGSLVLTAYNFVAPIEREGAPVTSAPDAPVAAK